MAAKCEKCRGRDTNALLGDNVSCWRCGHTGPGLPDNQGRAPEPVEPAGKVKRRAAE